MTYTLIIQLFSRKGSKTKEVLRKFCRKRLIPPQGIKKDFRGKKTFEQDLE